MAELRRDREVVRTAVSRFLSLLAPVTAIQLFTGPDNKPLDPRNHGLPTFGRRALERLRDQGVISLQSRFYSLVPERREELVEILADDEKVDHLHLSAKFLPKPKEKIDPEEVLRELSELTEGGGLLPDVEDPDAVQEVAPADPVQMPTLVHEGEELPFPAYVAARFDMLQEQVTDLSETLPVDTKAHLENLGEALQSLRGEVDTLVQEYLKTAVTIERLVTLVEQDHQLFALLRESLRPRAIEDKTNHA